MVAVLDAITSPSEPVSAELIIGKTSDGLANFQAERVVILIGRLERAIAQYLPSVSVSLS